MRDRPALDLFLISWLVLFLELACIRWFPSHVLFLTFFTNTVLLACFVGMSVGLLVARRPVRLIKFTPVWLLVAVAAGVLVDARSNVLQAVFDVGNQANPEVVYFGTEGRTLLEEKERPPAIPIEVVGGLFFLLIAATLVGPGQEMGRAFNRVPNRTTAYSANLLGSLVGIGMFAGFSLLRLPPIVWFGLTGLALLYLIVRKDPESSPNSDRAGFPLVPVACLVVAVGLTVITSGFFPVRGQQVIWSQYYRLDYEPSTRFITTNLISHQLMEPMDEATLASVPYSLPYLFQRDLKAPDGRPAWPPFKRILIIGAGNGNDVARALQFAAPDARIDAVEIDPSIQELGRLHHPNAPFADDRVKVTINDGRNFLRRAPDATYDLVVFALIDSLVLQSGYSSLRLENYLFTLESFQDVRRVLKPTGVFTVYNMFRQGWVAARIREQLRTAFDGVDPVVVNLPTRDVIPLDLNAVGYTGFFAGSREVIDPLRAAFAPAGMRYWYPWMTKVPKDTAAGFDTANWNDPASGKSPPPPPTTPREHPPHWYGISLSQIEDGQGTLRPATDDWPFLYTRTATLPGLTLRGVGLMLVLSLALWVLFGGARALGAESGVSPEWGLMLRSFFLGAGFMLIETKAVVEMALLFGGTWIVNTVVFAAILVMSLAGNLYAGWVKPRRLEPYYLGLFASLAVGLAVPPGTFLGLDPTVQIVAVCAIVFTPVAFAGVIFATTFRRTTQPDRVFGMNVAGALIGGLSENTSVVLGFRLLLCVAIGYYVFSALFGNRSAGEK
jgi:SAM-dependent methyltransferase